MKKGLKITLIVILSIVVLAGATLGIAYATQGDYVRNTFALWTKSDTEYFQWVTEKNVDKSMKNSKMMLLSTSSSKNGGAYGTVSTDFTIDISDKLMEMILAGRDEEMPKSLKPFGMNMLFAKGDGEFGSSFAIKYNGVDIISLASLIRINEKEAYIGLPSYKSDAIDLSELARTDLSQLINVAEVNDVLEKMGTDARISEADVKDIFTIIKKIVELGDNSSSEMQDPQKLDEAIATFNNEFNKVLSQIDEATLEKNVEVEVNGVSTKCNTITVKLTKKEIIEILMNYFESKEADLKSVLTEQLNIPAEQINQAIDQLKKEVEALKSNQEVSFSIDLVLYVNKKGEYIGANVKFGVSTVKVAINFVTDEIDDNNSTTGIEISVAGMRVATGTVTKTVEGTEETTVLSIKPGDIVKNFVSESAAKYSLEIKTVTDDGDTKKIKQACEISVKDGSDKLISVSIDTVTNMEEAVMPIKPETSKKIPYNQILDSDYFTIKDVALYVVNKLEAINDDFIDSKIKEFAEQFIGPSSSVEDLKKKIQDTDFSPLDKQLKESIENSLNGGSGSTDFFTPEPEPVEEDDSLKIDINEPHSYSKAGLASYVTPFEYSDIDVEVASIDYDELDRCKGSFLEDKEMAKMLTTDAERTVQYYDDILFDAVPLMAGIPVSMYEYKNVPATVGDYQYGEGIDDQLIGMKVGEKKTINLTLGDEFGDFAGYKGDFQVTVSGIYELVPPAWTEEYIVGALGYSSLQACEKEIIEANGLEAIYLDDSILILSIFEYTIENFVDDSVINDMYTDIYNEYLTLMDAQIAALFSGEATTYKEYLMGFGYSEEEVEEMISDTVRDNIRQSAIVAYVADKEGIVSTFMDVLEENNLSIDDVPQTEYDEYVSVVGEAELYDQMIYMKACEALLNGVKASK